MDECYVSKLLGCLRIGDNEDIIMVNVDDTITTTFHVLTDNGAIGTKNLATAIQLFRNHGNMTVESGNTIVEMKHSRRPDDHNLTVRRTNQWGSNLYNFYVKNFDSFVDKVVAVCHWD